MKVPTLPWELAETDKVEFPEPATEVGLKLPVTPLDNPCTLKLTVPSLSGNLNRLVSFAPSDFVPGPLKRPCPSRH